MIQLRVNKMSKLRRTHTKKPSAASEDKVSVCIPAQKSECMDIRERSKQDSGMSTVILLFRKKNYIRRKKSRRHTMLGRKIKGEAYWTFICY